MKVANSHDSRYYVRAAGRALDVLLALARSPQGVAELGYIVEQTKLHPSTVFRLLETLIAHDFVRQREGGGYEIGALAFEVGSAFLRRQSMWQKAIGLTEQLAGAVNETASVGVLDAGEVLYVAIAHGQEEIGIQSTAGTRHPAYCTALGKVLLAALPWDVAVDILSSKPRPQRTINTIVTLDAMRVELERIAVRGYAVDNEERLTGIRCISAAIRDHRGVVVAAISASGPTFRMMGEHFEAVCQAVIQSADSATRALGGQVASRLPVILPNPGLANSL